MKKVIIVGGGASGLFLACLLSNSPNYDITILEKNDRVGKKLLVTGNGKCNLSNINMTKDCYNHEFVIDMINMFDVTKTIQYFKSLGLLIKQDEQGRCYPVTESANTVLDILRNTLETNHVNCICNTKIENIKKINNKFILTDSNNKNYSSDILVLACGGKTYYPSCNGYDLVNKLNIKTTKLYPSLVGLKVKENLASIENLRCKASISLYQNDKKIYEDKGEILFKKNGLSGIVSFQICSYYNRLENKDNCTLLVDLLPDYDNDYLVNFLSNRHTSFDKLLDGILLKMIAKYVYKQLKHNDINELVYLIKHLPLSIESSYDFNTAQVTSGGVLLDEINITTMETKKIKDLYIIGELLDVDGICGGYNLQFAWSSASICAKHIERNE